MANCSNCGAPLPKNTSFCTYCKTKNDVDLRGLGDYVVDKPDSKRFCPRCEIPLQTLKVNSKEKLYIEQCKKCFGFFFDLGELEYLVSESVTNVFEIDHKRLGNIVGNCNSDYGVKYIKCPVCDKYMNRVNFGARSGVIIDKCKDHGIWLDGGELKQIMEWTKAGGKLFDNEKKNEAKKIADFKEKQMRRDIAIEQAKTDQRGGYNFNSGHGGYTSGTQIFGTDDIVSLLIKFVRKFF